MLVEYVERRWENRGGHVFTIGNGLFVRLDLPSSVAASYFSPLVLYMPCRFVNGYCAKYGVRRDLRRCSRTGGSPALPFLVTDWRSETVAQLDGLLKKVYSTSCSISGNSHPCNNRCGRLCFSDRQFWDCGRWASRSKNTLTSCPMTLAYWNGMASSTALLQLVAI